MKGLVIWFQSNFPASFPSPLPKALCASAVLNYFLQLVEYKLLYMLLLLLGTPNLLRLAASSGLLL